VSGKRLLVIDDETDFGTFVGRVASGLGFDAEVTATRSAFEAAYRRLAPTHIAIDMVMPEHDGIELVRWLATHGCKARILIISGYNPRYAAAAAEIGAAQGLLPIVTLQKPVSLADLRAALELRDPELGEVLAER
jgi:CheY-like chemotaxis protein